jgi:parvulin-like peptidyl-prolyl isomerase
MKNKVIAGLIIVFFVTFSWGCNNNSLNTIETNEPVIETTISPTLQITTIPPTITPTQEPAAAIVNEEPILLSDFEEEYLRYKDAYTSSDVDLDETVARATVLENMLDVLLLAQGSRKIGFQISDEIYQQRVDNLVSQLGSVEQLNAWMDKNHYNAESFKRLYKLEIEAAHMRDTILESVPKSAEQIRARQIMVQSKTMAEQIYSQLQSGADFATLAWLYDPITGGELSWFPANYLVIKEVEEAVFLLNAGEYTPIITTDYGYQIVQVIEKENDRPLTQDALFSYQRSALSNWIQDNKQNSSITILIN